MVKKNIYVLYFMFIFISVVGGSDAHERCKLIFSINHQGTTSGLLNRINDVCISKQD